MKQIIPPDSFAERRLRTAEERRRQAIINQSVRNSAVLRKLRMERAEEKARGKLLFCLWAMLDTRLRKAESMRDMHAPQQQDDTCDEEFCKAIQEIPVMREAARDAWLEYTAYGKGGE